MCFSSFPLADIFFRSFPTPLSFRGCKDPTQDRRTNVRVKNQEECSDTSTHGSTEPAGPLSSGRILHAFFGTRWRGLGYRLARPRGFHIVLSTLPRELTPRLPLNFATFFGWRWRGHEIRPCPSPRFSHCSPSSGELIPRVASQFWGIFCWRWRGHGIPCPSPEASHCSPSPGELIPRVASRFWPFFLGGWVSLASHSSLSSQWRTDASDCLKTDFGGRMARAAHCFPRSGETGALDCFSIHIFWGFWWRDGTGFTLFSQVWGSWRLGSLLGTQILVFLARALYCSPRTGGTDARVASR